MKNKLLILSIFLLTACVREQETVTNNIPTDLTPALTVAMAGCKCMQSELESFDIYPKALLITAHCKNGVSLPNIGNDTKLQCNNFKALKE